MSRPKSWLELSDGEDDEEENQRGETTNDNTLGGLSPVRGTIYCENAKINEQRAE